MCFPSSLEGCGAERARQSLLWARKEWSFASCAGLWEAKAKPISMLRWYPLPTVMPNSSHFSTASESQRSGAVKRGWNAPGLGKSVGGIVNGEGGSRRVALLDLSRFRSWRSLKGTACQWTWIVGPSLERGHRGPKSFSFLQCPVDNGPLAGPVPTVSTEREGLVGLPVGLTVSHHRGWLSVGLHYFGGSFELALVVILPAHSLDCLGWSLWMVSLRTQSRHGQVCVAPNTCDSYRDRGPASAGPLGWLVKKPGGFRGFHGGCKCLELGVA